MINTTGATPVALVNSVDYNDYGESVRPSQIQLRGFFGTKIVQSIPAMFKILTMIKILMMIGVMRPMMETICLLFINWQRHVSSRSK